MDELVTVPAGAKELGIAPRRIHRAIEEGKLRAFRMGSRWKRIYRADLHKWVRENLVQSAADRGRRRARRR